MVQFSLQNSSGKVVLLGGSMDPLGHNGNKSTLVTNKCSCGIAPAACILLKHSYFCFYFKLF